MGFLFKKLILKKRSIKNIKKIQSVLYKVNEFVELLIGKVFFGRIGAFFCLSGRNFVHLQAQNEICHEQYQ